jgi:ActR/RegA family two-component response regulator
MLCLHRLERNMTAQNPLPASLHNNSPKGGTRDRIGSNERKNVHHQMSDIVIVDDNAAILCVLAEIFSQHGYRVRTACDGFAALAVIGDRVPDILLSDLQMPRMSGFELLSVVRRRFPAIAVIAMSAAYAGVVVPPDIAADGFYAKGSSNIARLFEIVLTIQDEDMRQSLRVPVPLWIAGLFHHEKGHSTPSVACPDCLRNFSLSRCCAMLDRHEQICPYCLSTVQLAIVRQPGACTSL